MARLSAYRDLIVHHTPMASAGHKAYILAYCLANMASTCLPAVAFQIPIDPFETKQSRSQGPQFANVQEWIQASITAARRGEGPDALTFAHGPIRSCV